MRRLPSDKFQNIPFTVEDLPENCSTRFLLNRKSSSILIDNPLNPKLAVVTYPSQSPAMHFFYGKADRIVSIQHLLKSLTKPADLVFPYSMLPLISNNWPVRFSIPVLFLAANEESWRPAGNNHPNVSLLTPDNASQLLQKFAEHSWLWEFFGSPEGLLSEGQVTAAFIDGELAGVASTLAFTEKYCEIGVATRPEYQGLGLGLQCCQALTRIQYEQYGRLPCWRTEYHNTASRRIALKLGLNEINSEDNYIFVSNYQHVGAYATVAP